MAIDPALLEKARLRPHALRLEEALRLSRQLGFAKVRQVRGHRILHRAAAVARCGARSEEHTSELQSRFDLVCRLLLEKKKTTIMFAIRLRAYRVYRIRRSS